MKPGLLLIVALAAGCCGGTETRVALAPYPPSTPTAVAIPMRGTVLCYAGGAARIYSIPKDRRWPGGLYGTIDPWREAAGFGVNDSMKVIFQGKSFMVYTSTTVVMREVGK